MKKSLSLLCAFAATSAMGAQSHRIDQETGIETWQTTTAGVTVSLTQILPDQVRAFYVNRGFSLESIEPYATSCVYMTVLRNDAASGVAQFQLPDWRIVTEAEDRPPLSTSDWIERLEPANQGKAAMIAFRWAQFPTQHAYQPGGDWNQGMLSIGLKPGERFKLIAQWTVDDKNLKGELENVRCAQENQ